MHPRQDFPQLLQNALENFDKKTRFKNSKKIHPSIIRLKALTGKDRNDKFSLYSCFADDVPPDDNAAFPVYMAMLNTIAAIPTKQPRRIDPQAENERVQSLAEALSMLHKNHLLTAKNINKITIHPKPKALALALIYLKSKEITLDVNIVRTTYHHNDPVHVAEAFVMLHKLGIKINTAIVNAFNTQFDPLAIVAILTELKKRNLLTREYINLLLTHRHPLDALEAMKIFMNHGYAVGMNVSMFAAALAHRDPPELARALCKIKMLDLNADMEAEFKEWAIQSPLPTAFTNVYIYLHDARKDSQDNLQFMNDLFHRFNGICTLFSDLQNSALCQTILDHPNRDNFVKVLEILDRNNLVTAANINVLLDPELAILLDTKTVQNNWKTMQDEMTQSTFNIVVNVVIRKDEYSAEQTAKTSRRQSGLFDVNVPAAKAAKAAETDVRNDNNTPKKSPRSPRE